jgi:putative hemolysin
MAASRSGFYSSAEFDLSEFPTGVLEHSVELGRACVARKHRNARVLFLLWRGISRYLTTTGKRWAFGCSSLAGQNVAQARYLYGVLRDGGHLHPDFEVPPQPGFTCFEPERDGPEEEVPLPHLMRLYLSHGMKVCGPPAIDRGFNTIDFLGIIDTATVPEDLRQRFFV